MIKDNIVVNLLNFKFKAMQISEMGYTSALLYGLCVVVVWGSIKFDDPILNLVYIWFTSAIMANLYDEKAF